MAASGIARWATQPETSPLATMCSKLLETIADRNSIHRKLLLGLPDSIPAYASDRDQRDHDRVLIHHDRGCR
ncbi:hypothetical protein Q31b_31740 [Novipirellula aureliae]|uniref:Uncharacterized protein n=1 Tax=Novipirellula aureliae TaxID=2527966 RepID=A0A5C6DYB5_9BACT|nr:hypothetical protein Q31b_31740 [Novipirellula aureliae]